jgi:tryptophan-rich sensory protein
MRASRAVPALSRQIAGLVGWLAVTFAAAAVGAIGSAAAPAFYEQLARPNWAPPAALFGPVWTALYTAMALAAWLVWRRHALAEARGAFTLFAVQLAANALWSWLFFGWRLGAAAFAEVLLLWASIAATIVTFRRLSVPAAILLLPYLAWVTFASFLTFAVWRLNPDSL